MNSTNHSAIETYLQYGDSTPPLGVLEYCAGAIPVDTGAKSVVLADVFIDASTQDTRNSASHLRTAEGLLNDVVDHANYLIEKGYEREAELKSTIAVTAGLRLIDLQKYKSWVLSGVALNNYADTISTVSTIAAFSRSVEADDKLREYFPVLFAARRLHRSEVNKLSFAAGRLALSREDMRPFSAPGVNPRWDCGLFSEEEHPNFIKPSKKLQVKVGKKKHSVQYALAGVKCLSLKQHGLDDTFDVLDRCSLELGQPMICEGEPISTRELDIRANRLLSSIEYM